MLHLILATALIAQAAQQPLAPAIEVTTQEAMQHRPGKPLFLRVAPKQRTQGIFSSIKVAVTVDATGAVISADALRQAVKPEYGLALYTDAKSLVWKLHYVPFVRDGHAVSAKFSEYVALLPPELTPEKHVPFPDTKDWKSIKITLRRTSCFGACPAYRVEVNGDGTVVLQWERFNGPGEVRRGTISEENFFVLLYMFVTADFYSLRDSYHAGVTDLPAYFVSIDINGQKKQVEDYAGREVGMPLIVTELEDAIDQFSGAANWVKSVTGREPRE